jgi:hypothetical protein
MRKFKKGDKVVFIEDHHSPDYIRNYNPSRGSIGVIQSFSELCDEYIVLFENANATTFCYEGEIELVKSKEPVLFINPNGLEVKCQDIIVDKYQTQIDYYNKIFNKEKYNRYVKGEWNNMNKVLELWYTRKHSNIMKEYEEKGIEFNESKELVIKYKEILDRFETELEELYESEENQEQNYIINTMTNNLYEYNIDYKKLDDEFSDKYIIERDEKLHELNELRKEIDAQLSLSDELEYQVDVLMRYGVLDKKTKKMVD